MKQKEGENRYTKEIKERETDQLGERERKCV
jgi:hypothetical protein